MSPLRRRRAHLSGGALCVAVFAAPRPASADPRVLDEAPRSVPAPASLQWHAPPGCPRSDTVTARVGHHLGRPLPAASPSRAEARIFGGSPPWRLQLRVETQSGFEQIEVEDSDCEVLADLVALKFAMALDPGAVMRRLSGEAHEPPAPVLEPPAPPSRPTPQTRGFPLAVALYGTAGHVALPAVAVGTGGELWVERGTFRAALGAVGWFPRRSQHGSAEVAFDLWTAQLSACAVLRRRDWAVPLCGGAEAGQLRGTPTGVSEPQPAHRTWLAILTGPAVEWAAGPHIRLWARARATIPLLRPGFHIDGHGSVHRLPVIGGQAALGFALGWR